VALAEARTAVQDGHAAGCACQPLPCALQRCPRHSNALLKEFVLEEKRVTKPPKLVLLNLVCLLFLYLVVCKERGGNKVKADDCEQRLLLMEVLSNFTLGYVLQHLFRGWTWAGKHF